MAQNIQYRNQEFFLSQDREHEIPLLKNLASFGPFYSKTMHLQVYSVDYCPNFHIHVSASDLYIPTFGPPIFLQQKRQTDQRIMQIAHRNMNVGIGTVAAQFLSWEYLFRIFGIVSLQCVPFVELICGPPRSYLCF